MNNKKNQITRYIPSFVDIDRNNIDRVQFDTLKELMEVPWVKARSIVRDNPETIISFTYNPEKKTFEEPEDMVPPPSEIFLKYSIGDNSRDYASDILLMAEYWDFKLKKKKWWVVGHLKFDIPELPRFSQELNEEDICKIKSFKIK